MKDAFSLRIRYWSIFWSLLVTCFSAYGQARVEKWQVFEVTLNGPRTGNPFTEVKLTGTFTHNRDTLTVPGFYDGNGVYKIRFMPQQVGKYTYTTACNSKSLNGKKGAFSCLPPQAANHGPVAVRDTFFFAHADGTPHTSFGTTCYAWVHQGDELAKTTLHTLSKGYFNKVRLCIFPKSFDWNNSDPVYYPFAGTPPQNWDYTHMNPVFFRNIEKRIAQLDSMGIQADLILYHPYDKWGFSSMSRPADDLYLDYVIARFAAYKNVWWSVANEYDFLKDKKWSDWDYYIEKIASQDKFQHLLSIHNGFKFYDHTNPRLTHVSIQGEDTYKAKEYRKTYQKPVIFDECRYEGNVPWSWGNLTAQSMTDKFWRGVTNGGYAGHGETYVTESPITLPRESTDTLWWSKGGVLRGESPARIKFLRQIIEAAPAELKPIPLFFYWMPFSCIGIDHEYYLAYLTDAQPRSIVIDLPKDALYNVEIIDTWNMHIQPAAKKYTGHCIIELPGKPYTAVRITKQK